MPHSVTNRQRHYNGSNGGSRFSAEAVNAATYIIGGATFTAGSIGFLPAMEAYYGIGVWLFVAGSVLYLLVTSHDAYETAVSMRRNDSDGAGPAEATGSALYWIGSLLFVVGSILFLPDVKLAQAGAWCFTIGSAMFVIGAAINVLQITRAGSQLTLQLLNAVAICFIVGSILFIVGSVPYIWDERVATGDKQPLHTYLALQFAAASALFLAAGFVNFYRARLASRHYRGREDGSNGRTEADRRPRQNGRDEPSERRSQHAYG